MLPSPLVASDAKIDVVLILDCAGVRVAAFAPQRFPRRCGTVPLSCLDRRSAQAAIFDEPYALRSSIDATTSGRVR